MNHNQNFSCVIILIIWHSSCQVNSQPRFGIQVLQAPMSYIILSCTFQEVVHHGCHNFVIGPQSDLSSPNNCRKSREIITLLPRALLYLLFQRGHSLVLIGGGCHVPQASVALHLLHRHLLGGVRSHGRGV